MTLLPRVEPKRCEVLGCTTRFDARGRRRRCNEHRGRPWLELWIARVRAGLTVRELADRAGMRDIHVHQLQSGYRVARAERIATLADALGVPARQLAPSVHTVVPADLVADVDSGPAVAETA